MTNRQTDSADESPIERRPERYVARHEWDRSRPLTRTVIEVLEAVPEVSLRSEAALYEEVDVEALETLFRNGSADPGAEVRFTFQGCEVVVTGDGVVTVWTDDDSPARRSGQTPGD